MSWRQICQTHGHKVILHPRWTGTDAQLQLVRAAKQRIFGGMYLEGFSEAGRARGGRISRANVKLLSSHDRETHMNQLKWPFVRPETMSGRWYRERAKYNLKVQAGLKGPAKGQVEAEKEAAKKKKK